MDIINQKLLKGEKIVINFNKNKLINETLDKYYDTFSHTMDTADYVPERFNKKICKYIFKNMKKAFRRIDKQDRKYQRMFRKNLRKKDKEKRKAEKALKPKKKWFNFFKKSQRTN